MYTGQTIEELFNEVEQAERKAFSRVREVKPGDEALPLYGAFLYEMERVVVEVA
jgi:hypothetical protein